MVSLPKTSLKLPWVPLIGSHLLFTSCCCELQCQTFVVTLLLLEWVLTAIRRRKAVYT